MSEVPHVDEEPQGYRGYGPFQHTAGQAPQPQASLVQPMSPQHTGEAGPPGDVEVSSPGPAAESTAATAAPNTTGPAYPAANQAPTGEAPYPTSGAGYQVNSEILREQKTAHPHPAPTRPPSTPPAADSWSLFPDGPPGSPSWQPRIVPVPKPSKRRIVISGLLGALAGLIVFGTTGFFVGYQSAPRPAPAPKPAPSKATGLTVLPPFEQAQLNLNKPKFDGDLATIAEPWLPYVTSCTKSGEKGGPALVEGEETRILCRYANVSVYFIRYKSIDARDKIRTTALAQNIDAKQLAPGVAEPTQKKAASGKADGNYVEYAFRSSSDANGRTICGLWWDDAHKPVAAYLLASWTDGLGESWEPLRDIWRRYS